MRLFSAVLNILREVSLSQNWDLNDDEYMKIFSWMLYIVLEQQWTSSTMTRNCQWSSRSRTILKRIAADSGSIIAENALRTLTNKEVWIASILSNWETMGLNFRIPHTKGMWGKRKNECQEMQSFLHTLIHISVVHVTLSGLKEDICRVSESIQPLPTKRSIKGRIKWVYRKEEVAASMVAIDRHKQSLLTKLSVIYL